MSWKHLISCLVGSMGLLSVTYSQNKPFPQHTIYTTGHIKPSTYSQTQLDAHVTSFYDQWKVTYLDNSCGGGQYFVAKDPNENVSEGTAYGMMLTAFMAGYDASAKTYFDGLYNFYKAHPSSINAKLMAWKQVNCIDTGGPNSAADGDIDIAYALLLADEQWGSSGTINYLAEAQTMINAIMQDDINPSTWAVKLGDWVNSSSSYYHSTRSSDFIIDHFRAFECATSNSNWSNVINTCYDLVNTIQTNYSSTTGLLPDFIINVDGTPTPAGANFLESNYDGHYYYNACRVPWRLATDYLLHGTAEAKTAVNAMNNWLKTATNSNPANLSNGYYLDGTSIFGWHNPDFAGGFAVGAMVDGQHQTWLDALYADILNASFASNNYYENTLKLLYMVVISGNYWTPACSSTAPPTPPNTLPQPALVGYWQNWNDPSSPYMALDQIDTRYNVVEVAFALPKAGTTYDMEFVPLVTTSANLISQIQTLQAQDKKVLISIGGATATVKLDNTTQKNTFVSSMLNIINTYGFDGIDIDLEGSSVAVSGGTTIANPTDATITNMISAIQEIMSSYYAQDGQHLLLTMAPETAFVQGGQSGYGGIWGAYLPIIHALRDSIDLLQVQLYNSGSMYGIDGNIYTQGTADFIISQTDALLQGFNTSGGYFSPLNETQIAIGLPACPSAAGGGYTTPMNVKAAMDYLMGNGTKPGSYTLTSTYPNLGGMMTWSINWDALGTCGGTYEYATNFETIFGNITSTPIPVADFTATPTTGSDPLLVNFDASTTTDTSGTALTYQWDFGDGMMSTSVTTSHTYTTYGTYIVTLTVMNGLGGSATHQDTITVTSSVPLPPVVSLTSPTDGSTLGLITYTLQATATDPDGTIANVHFNVNGTTIAASNTGGNTYEASWTPTIVGTYTIIATATDNDGEVSQDISIVTVQIGSVLVTFDVTSDWATGYCANITLTNNGITEINGWTLDFDLDASIYDLWNANWSNTGGNHYTTSDVGWNADIAIGESETFGFCANYTAPLTPPTNGMFNSSPISFNGITQTLPSVTITAPANNANLSLETLTLSADAIDFDGTIASVNFTVNGTPIAASNTSGNTYEASWTPATVGAYTIIATATDNDGQMSQDISTVTIQTGDVVATFSVTSDWGTGYCANIALTNNGLTEINGWTLDFDLEASIYDLWNANWSNTGGNHYTTSDVGWNADIAIGESETFGFCANYTAPLTPPTSGMFNSSPISFNGIAQTPPSVTITAPVNNATLPLGTITLSADAIDSDGSIASVNFTVNSTTLAASNTSGNTYESNWTPTTSGVYTIVAIVTDNAGLINTHSITVAIQTAPAFEIRTVNKGNGVIGVEMRETSGLSPTTSDSVTDLVFGIKWSSSYGVDLTTVTNSGYNIVKSGSRETSGAFHFQAFAANATPFNFPENWTMNTWVEIMSISNDLQGAGLGTFEICEVGFDATTNPNIGVSSTDHTPTINGKTTDVTIPVNLVSFGTQLVNDYVLLEWTTASEENNQVFEIERSSKQIIWEKIGSVVGNGTSYESQEYFFKDRQPLQGDNYYRLKQIDYDGNFSFSNTAHEFVKDLFDEGISSEAIYPNPSQDGIFTITLQKSHNNMANLTIFNTSFLTVLQKRALIEANQVQLNLSHLPKGAYFFKLETDTFSRTGKLIIQ